MQRLQTSRVQAHPGCALIDSAIARGEPAASIARTFGLSPWSIRRRRAALRAYPDYVAALAAE